MATIVQLPSSRSSIPRESMSGASATILFFTGVRYVRDEEADTVEDDSAELLPAPLSQIKDTADLVCA